MQTRNQNANMNSNMMTVASTLPAPGIQTNNIPGAIPLNSMMMEQMDMVARMSGFNSAEEMMAFQQNLMMSMMMAQGQPGQPGQAGMPPTGMNMGMGMGMMGQPQQQQPQGPNGGYGDRYTNITSCALFLPPLIVNL
jgi:hypothetical protein